YHLSPEQLSLAFGDWSNYQDRNHLHDWLLSDTQVKTNHSDIDLASRQRLLDAIDDTQIKRQRGAHRVEECRRHLRDAELLRRDFTNVRAEPVARRAEDIRRDLADALIQL